jgi:superfamily I DNA/RNA helicase
MTLDFFEGAAGTGKTHNLVGRASEQVLEGILGDDRRVLALTFMNGARRRLEARLGQSALFRRRFQCQTFDVFARTVAARRKSLLSGNAAALAQAATLNEFDGPCFLAGQLLEMAPVQQWVAASFPLILVDEAQDLDDHRTRVLQGLSAQCGIVAAADSFQCLVDGRDTTNIMSWLEGAGQTHRLTRPRRTAQRGLLAAANAVRNGQSIRAVLIKSQKAQTPTWNGQGFRLIETHAKNAGLVAWAIANEMAQRSGPIAILTPDSKNVMLRNALDMVRARQWTWKKMDKPSGHFRFLGKWRIQRPPPNWSREFGCRHQPPMPTAVQLSSRLPLTRPLHKRLHAWIVCGAYVGRTVSRLPKWATMFRKPSAISRVSDSDSRGATWP